MEAKCEEGVEREGVRSWIYVYADGNERREEKTTISIRNEVTNCTRTDDPLSLL